MSMKLSGSNNLNRGVTRLVRFGLIALLLWIAAFISSLFDSPAHLKRSIAVLAVGGIAAALGWHLRHRKYRAYLTGTLCIAVATSVYFLLRPYLFDTEFVFALCVVAISALWGLAPGFFTAVLATIGYGTVNLILAPHAGALAETLALGGFFVASAAIVGALTHHRQWALAARARLAGELEETYEATLRALAAALDARDHETRGHSERVTALTLAIARELGLQPKQLRPLRWGALLHGVGKIGVPDHILREPGPLTNAEWAQMRQHPQIGHDILSSIPFLRPALEIVLYHHERYDGGGYPCGLQGDAIPLPARIFAVADTFDAIISDRPYRKKRSPDEALAEIRRLAGQQFDPRVVQAFERILARQGARPAQVAQGTIDLS